MLLSILDSLDEGKINMERKYKVEMVRICSL